MGGTRVPPTKSSTPPAPSKPAAPREPPKTQERKASPPATAHHQDRYVPGGARSAGSNAARPHSQVYENGRRHGAAVSSFERREPFLASRMNGGPFGRGPGHVGYDIAHQFGPSQLTRSNYEQGLDYLRGFHEGRQGWELSHEAGTFASEFASRSQNPEDAAFFRGEAARYGTEEQTGLRQAQADAAARLERERNTPSIGRPPQFLPPAPQVDPVARALGNLEQMGSAMTPFSTGGMPGPSDVYHSAAPSGASGGFQAIRDAEQENFDNWCRNNPDRNPYTGELLPANQFGRYVPK